MPHHDNLPNSDKGIYIRYGSKCQDQHWGTKETVQMCMSVARTYKKFGDGSVLLIGDISSKEFSKTQCHSAHKTGTHVDMDLAESLPKDPDYGKKDQQRCAKVCWYAIYFGAKRVLFSDSKVAKAVNVQAKKQKKSGRVVVRADHDDHFHIEMPI